VKFSFVEKKGGSTGKRGVQTLSACVCTGEDLCFYGVASFGVKSFT